MGYQEKNGSVTVHAKLSDLGKKYLLTDPSRFQIAKFSPFDDGVDYSLWNINHTDGSPYYGAAIESLPMLEPVVSNVFQAKYNLIRDMDISTIRMPIFVIQPTSVSLEFIDSETVVSVQIQNVNEPQMKVILLDATVADIEAVGGGSTPLDVNPLAMANFIGQSGFSYAKAFLCNTTQGIRVTPKRNENDFNVVTKVIIIGTTTNARAELPVTIQPNTTIVT